LSVPDEKGKIFKKLQTDLAEKSADDHVQYVHKGLFLSVGEQALDEQNNEENVEEEKSDIS